jgi:DinB family protein
MNRASTMIVTVLLAGACAVHAQDANPISANLKQSWTNIRDLLVKVADRMPDENYRFKPTPDVQDFGQRMAHVIGFNVRACSLLQGAQKNITFTAAPSKAEITTAMKQANDACDSIFNSMTDADVLKTIDTGRGGQRTKLALIEGNVLEHSQEVYGYVAVYLRLKGIVPPSSERNEH